MEGLIFKYALNLEEFKLALSGNYELYAEYKETSTQYTIYSRFEIKEFSKKLRGHITEIQYEKIMTNPKKKLGFQKQINRKTEYERSKIKFEQYDCRICLDYFNDKEIIVNLKCEHIFHHFCILNWREKSINCPICKYYMI